jgi:hypothetical protein
MKQPVVALEIVPFELFKESMIEHQTFIAKKFEHRQIEMDMTDIALFQSWVLRTFVSYLQTGMDEDGQENSQIVLDQIAKQLFSILTGDYKPAQLLTTPPTGLPVPLPPPGVQQSQDDPRRTHGYL